MSFGAEVNEWVQQSEKRVDRVFKMSAQKLVDAMLLPKNRGGNMPVDTGNLRRSLMASTSSMPAINFTATEFSGSDGQIQATIAGVEIGGTLYFGFQAAYARRMNYGFHGADSLGRIYNQEGNAFVELAAQKWQGFVNDSARELQNANV